MQLGKVSSVQTKSIASSGGTLNNPNPKVPELRASDFFTGAGALLRSVATMDHMGVPYGPVSQPVLFSTLRIRMMKDMVLKMLSCTS